MKISKQRLRQILREELKTVLEQDLPDPNSQGTIFDQWRNIFSSATANFQNAYNTNYNQATGATNPAATPAASTATATSATPPVTGDTDTYSTERGTVRFYFKPETTQQEITRANITNLMQTGLNGMADQIDISVVISNLRSIYANAGYPPNYDWTEYANQLKEAFKSSIRVSAPNIQENNEQTIASLTFQMSRIETLQSPNDSLASLGRGSSGERPAENFISTRARDQINRVLPDKLLPAEQTPNRRNPEMARV